MAEAQPVSMFKTPKQTLLAVMKDGGLRGKALWWQLFAVGFHAGMFISFGGGLVVTVVGALDSTVPAGLKKLIAGAVFPVCLMLIVATGAELFTGNVMFMLAARMAGQTSWKGVLKNWIMAYFGNLCGALATAYFLFHLSDMFGDPKYATFLHNMAIDKTEVYTFGEMMLKGVGCNYLVCLSLWSAVASHDIASKFIAIWWPLMVFVTIGFEHSIANMFYVPMAIMNGTGNVTAVGFIVKNLIPVTIGNILGGGIFVSMQYLVYHPYIAADLKIMHETKHKRLIPKYEDTIFRDVACVLWRCYCQFVKHIFGMVLVDINGSSSGEEGTPSSSNTNCAVSEAASDVRDRGAAAARPTTAITATTYHVEGPRSSSTSSSTTCTSSVANSPVQAAATTNTSISISTTHSGVENSEV